MCLVTVRTSCSAGFSGHTINEKQHAYLLMVGDEIKSVLLFSGNPTQHGPDASLIFCSVLICVFCFRSGWRVFVLCCVLVFSRLRALNHGS